MRKRFMAYVPGSVAVPTDTTPPTVPTGVLASSITSAGFSLTWNPSTDAVGVTGYDVQLDGVSYATPQGPNVVVTGRAAATTYSVRVRARDAAGNFSALSTAAPVTTSAVSALTLYSAQTPSVANANDGQAVVVGNTFTSDVDGSITGVRFYRATTAPTSVIGIVYGTSSRTELARVTFGTLSAGWNTATFTTPIAVTAGTAYTVAYWSSGPYVATGSTQLPLTSGHLSMSGSMYVYSATPAYPINGTTSGNGIGSLYFADVNFSLNTVDGGNTGGNTGGGTTNADPLHVNRIAQIGDSLTFDADFFGFCEPAFTSQGWTHDNIYLNGLHGRGIAQPSTGSTDATAGPPYTEDVIASMRASGFDPRVWVMALGTNNPDDSSTWRRAAMQRIVNLINAGPATDYKIYWIGTGYPVAGAFDQVATWADIQFVAANNANVTACDYAAFLNTKRADPAFNTWWDGGIHNTATGYQVLRMPFIASCVAGEVNGGSGGGNATAAVTHGEQLTLNHVGPWSLQGVAKGSEGMLTVPLPSRGYWQIATTSEWAPTTPYVYNNNAANKGGVVPAGGMTIDGYAVPAGTVVAQFRDFSAGDFSAQGQGGQYLFRGCRFRSNAIGQSSQFNDFTSTYTNRLFYCDMGSPTSRDVDWQGAFWKAIGGTGHIMHRNYCSYQYVTFQPNVPNCQFNENYVEKLIYFGGEAGPPGQPGDPLHMACIGCEGGGHGFRVLRNKIIPASPDEGGHQFLNGSSIAFEGTNQQNYADCQVKDNYLSGFNYVILDFGEVAGSSSIVVTGNKVTTRWFTNGGLSGVEQVGTAPPTWGSNGNVKSGNVWADDYGTGGTGTGTPLSSRQYPAGNGPRVGTTAF